ncbi:PIG-L deacetylase family protein [Pseudodesulfovibrio sp.]|uniref:PIG-L deacetylase family protein n=1 Tax=Pseudodesulfovibrio sp. TaxID=2035812 RepID=UPI002613A238|nr:PIG-L deacetylase family protein [Pseudodesulfovibrio sp.]MDD3311831.1 PIG-L family deacetylase [Pseudodesulfovibrio sp.]
MFDCTGKKVLAVAAHPDDETLGCGGTLARLAAQGAEVVIILLGEGPTSRLDSDAAASRSGAARSAGKAASILNATELILGNMPDNRFDSVPLLDLVQFIEKSTREFDPDIIFTHHAGDLNIDHSLTHRAVMTAFRPLPGKTARTILGFEVLSSTEYAPPGAGPQFTPQVYVNVADQLDRKIEALGAYEEELQPWPHPRSAQAIQALAALRGSQCGCIAAEAFMLYRAIIP